MIFRLLVIFFIFLLSACSIRHPSLPRPTTAYLEQTGEIRNCARLFTGIEQQVINYDAVDTQAARIKGFPYLRTNRFLSSLLEDVEDKFALQLWLSQLRSLDQESRMLELNNIHGLDREFRNLNVKNREDLNKQLQHCGEMLVAADITNPGQIDRIKSGAKIPDNYSDITRKTGLYALTKPFVMTGVKRLHNEIKSTFNSSINTETIHNIIMYGPEVPFSQMRITNVAGLIRERAKNPLHIPIIPESEEERLFLKYAPVWDIEVKSDNDKPGTPYWIDKKSLTVDISNPAAYRYLSYARLDKQILLQLNYIIWFKARSVNGIFDLLGGHIDGITWRVTLDEKGKPVMYDAMHNCGCYHMFLPDSKLVLQNSVANDEEPILVPAAAPEFIENKRIHIRVASDNHYIKAVYNGADDAMKEAYTIYKIVDYNMLRSLPLPEEGYKSMFDSNGIVPGTNRKERWILWPMGILSPGAMRQWGHHAIAFIGKRHFDDPYLIDRFFKPDSNLQD